MLANESARVRWPRKSTLNTSARFPFRTSLSRSNQPATMGKAGRCSSTCRSAASSTRHSGIFSAQRLLCGNILGRRHPSRGGASMVGSYRGLPWLPRSVDERRFCQHFASIFLQITRPKTDDFPQFLEGGAEILTEKNEFGFRPIDVGPVTMGVRLSSPKTGYNVYDESCLSQRRLHPAHDPHDDVVAHGRRRAL